MSKVLVVDGNPKTRGCKFLNFTSDQHVNWTEWNDHARDILKCLSDSTSKMGGDLDLIFCQVVENYTDGSDDYMSDATNHANLNRALLWAIEQGIEYVYMGFFFYSPHNSILNKDTNRLTRRIKIFCASENSRVEFRQSCVLIKKGAVTYCPSKILATYVSATRCAWPDTIPFGDDWTSRLTASAVVKAISQKKT